MIKVITEFFKLYPKNTILVCILFFLQSLLESVGISLVIPVFQKMLGDGTENTLAKYIDQVYYAIGLNPSIENIFLGLIFVYFCKSVIMMFSRHVVSISSAGFLYGTRVRIIKAMLEVNISYLSDKRQGDLISTITNESERAATSFVHSAQWISSFLSFILYVSCALYISSGLAVAAALTSVLVLSPLKLLSKIVKKYGVKTTYYNEEFQVSLIESFSAMKVIKASSFEKGVYKSITKIMSELRDNWAKSYFHANSVHIYSEPIVIALLCGIFYFAHKMGIPFVELIVFLLVFQRLLPSFTNMLSIYNNINLSIQGFDKVEKIIKESRESVEIFGTGDCPELNGSIHYKNINFSYIEDRPVFQGLDLQIPFGKTVAFLGESGSGKTTLVDLLLGFYRVEDGQLLINDTNINDFDLRQWRAQISYVSQEPILFHASVYENITWGVTEAEKDKVIEASKKAAAHEFIKDLAKGYDTIVGDNGVKLSGGQRQRIVLARALLKKPKVLILDEATSALDHESELAIKDSINQLKRNNDITIIMIAHRLTTVKEADIIFILENGKLKEQGSWKELINKDESYLQKSSTVLG
ncbi:ABC transporter ATP-binding protein [Bacteriovoracaceae bacterium]|nr:ABC transporter ATP-binding protein [Bacteriovoracaceae bacterium]